MNIDRLRYFSVVAATGSVTRAANLLRMTQPALSKAMRLLEQELGTELLQKRGRGIELTEAGTYLAHRLGPLLDDISAIPDELATRVAARRPLRYGSHESFGTYFTKLLMDRDEDLEFEHRYHPPGAIENAVASSAVDVGIGYIAVPTQGVEHMRIGSITMGVYGLSKWARVSFSKWRFAAPALPPFGAAVRAQGLDGWPDDRIPRTVSWRVTHTETALELCRQGRAVACFPEFVVELHNQWSAPSARLNQLPSRDVATEWSQPVYLSHREGPPPPGFDVLRDAVASIARGK